MKRLTNTKHLFFSERLSRCSDPAQLHHARLMLCCNTMCRSELSPDVIRRTAYPTMQVKPTDDELFAWWAEYSKHHLLFIYTDPATGALWGEWLIPDEYKPSYPYAEDKRSPAPDPAAIEVYRRSYYDEKKRKSQKALNISELSESVPSVPKCSEVPELSESVSPVVVVVPVEVEEKIKNKYKDNAAAPPSADAAVGVCSDSSQTKSKKAKAAGPTPEDYVAYWNRHCYPLEPVTDFTDDLKRLLIARMKSYPLTPRKFAEVLDTATRKDYCIGKAPGNTWSVDFEFVVRSNRNIAKIMNGLGRLQPRKPKESQLDAHWQHVKDLGPVGYVMQLEQRREQARTLPEFMKSKRLAEIDAREAEAKQFFADEAARQRAKERGAKADAEFLAEPGIAAEAKPQKPNGGRHVNA